MHTELCLPRLGHWRPPCSWSSGLTPRTSVAVTVSRTASDVNHCCKAHPILVQRLLQIQHIHPFVLPDTSHLRCLPFCSCFPPMARISLVAKPGGGSLKVGIELASGTYSIADLALAAHPYHILLKHFDIDFAAPKGPNPQADLLSAKVCYLVGAVLWCSNPHYPHLAADPRRRDRYTFPVRRDRQVQTCERNHSGASRSIQLRRRLLFWRVRNESDVPVFRNTHHPSTQPWTCARSCA